MEQATQPYTVLARRFRPQAFDDVVGQQHVARALRNAIAQERVAHAYLFTGARGVGKTSMARILAKALNCPNAVDGNPCNQCEICRNVAAGQDVDVSEIDGASNRGIDDIRQLRANVNVRSMRTKYKMYIIDEVHMLTKEAFNALLKTLEEPPPGVKFVFCTTEPNKVPDTILSRCQRFDFATIETQNIIVRLQEIAAAEGFDVDSAAVELVARRANGSMRDSQSLFDQLLAFGSDHVTADDVHRLLGTASDDRLISLVQSLIDRDREAALRQLDEAIRAGVQLGELVDQLLGYCRDLMILVAGSESVGLISVSAENRAPLQRQATQWGLKTILAVLEMISETKSRMFRSGFARALVEMALVRVTLLQELDSLEELLKQMRGLATSTLVRSDARSSTTTTVGRAGDPDRLPPSPSLPSVHISTAKPPSLPAPSTEPSQKKSSDEPLSPSLLSISEQNTPEPPEGLPHSFLPGNEHRLWKSATAPIQDLLQTHVRAVKNVAISGPNQLDLTFPKSYHFSKQYCEQPAVLARLEQLVSAEAGIPVRLRTILVEEPPAESKMPAAPLRRRVPENVDDAFVQQAMAVFGATIARVDYLSNGSEESKADVS